MILTASTCLPQRTFLFCYTFYIIKQFPREKIIPRIIASQSERDLSLCLDAASDAGANKEDY